MSLLIWDGEYAGKFEGTKEGEEVLLWDGAEGALFVDAEEFHDWFYDTFVPSGHAALEDLELVERWLGLDE